MAQYIKTLKYVDPDTLAETKVDTRAIVDADNTAQNLKQKLDTKVSLIKAGGTDQSLDSAQRVEIDQVLTKSAYDALSTSEKNNGKAYYVTDEDEVGTTVVQTTGTSTTNVMSQNAVTTALTDSAATRVALIKEGGVDQSMDSSQRVEIDKVLTKSAYDSLTTAEKNNGKAYYVTDEDSVGTTVVQTTGSSLTNVMSQSASTNSFVAKAQGSSNAYKIFMTDGSGSAAFFEHDSSAGFHNSIYRGKYLGTSITTAQNTAIANRTYDDMYIGDYWTINGVNWRIAAFEYYYNCGDTNFTAGHIIVVPDSNLTSAVMNDTDDTTGGYAGSKMRGSSGGLATAKTIITAAFGSHVAAHRVIMTNASGSSGPTGWAWMDSDGVELMNEVQVYGAPAFSGTCAGHYYDVGTQKQQLPLFAMSPKHINTRTDYWLQDIPAAWPAGTFCIVNHAGGVASDAASYSRGVRPAITIKAI